MNKKSTLYLLLALIAIIAITDSSYATPTPIIHKKRNDVKTTRDARNGTDSTPPIARQFGINNNKITADSSNNFPTGMLFFNDPDTGNLLSCTASVINTLNGNIGITAGHCLINPQGKASQNLVFSPGYDHGNDGPLGRIPVAVFQVTDKFRSNYNGDSDYGMMRFAFNDPSGQNLPLQAYTGANGWKINIGDDVQTTVVGYPYQGNIPNCPNDAQTLCTWQGTTKLTGDGYYATTDDVNFGNGASGAPWIWNYDTNTNEGWVYATLTGIDQNSHESLSPVYTISDWYALLNYVSNN